MRALGFVAPVVATVVFAWAPNHGAPVMARFTDDCIVCNDQWDCPVDHHIAPNVEGDYQRGGGSHGSCWEGLCTAEVGGLPAKHPRCAPEAPEQFQELLAAVASNLDVCPRAGFPCGPVA